MNLLLVLTLSFAQSTGDWRENCASPDTDRTKAACAAIEEFDQMEIETVESVGVGTHQQMLTLRPRARKCGLMNRIDYVSNTISVFDIINANDEGKACLVSWIETNAPELTYTDENFQQLFRQSSRSSEEH